MHADKYIYEVVCRFLALGDRGHLSAISDPVGLPEPSIPVRLTVPLIKPTQIMHQIPLRHTTQHDVH